MKFSRHVPVHSKAAKCRCSHSTASFANAVCGPARVGLSSTFNLLGAALNAVASGEVDLALVSNYLPFRSDIATVMPLYPTVLHIASRIQGVETIR